MLVRDEERGDQGWRIVDQLVDGNAIRISDMSHGERSWLGSIQGRCDRKTAKTE